VYFASSASLATLEIMVHLQNYAALRLYTLWAVSIPKTQITVVDEEKLSNFWRQQPAPQANADLGDEFLISNKKAVLSVPSAVMPMERNYVLNVENDRASSIIESAEAISFLPDDRLFGA